jgi:hypothetical protein
MPIKTEKFLCLLTLFLFTGIALKIYLKDLLNRERDYALVGSLCFCHMDRFWSYALYESAQNI